MASDYSHTILCVDDEQNILNALKRLLRKENYRILFATSGKEGLEILSENEVQLVLCDQRMPEMSGTEFLEKVCELYPDTIRITLTGYTEVDSITEAINRGDIHKFFLKPWNDDSLRLEVKKALERYDFIQDNKALHDKVVMQNEELKTVNDNLESMVQKRTHQLEIRNQALELSREVLDELPLGIIGISQEGIIALNNFMSQQIRTDFNAIELGQKVSDCFSEEIVSAVDKVISDNSPLEIKKYECAHESYYVRLLPFSSRFSGKGIIMTMDRLAAKSIE